MLGIPNLQNKKNDICANHDTIMLSTTPLPRAIFEFLTLITNGPDLPLCTTVTCVLGKSPIVVSRTLIPRPPSILIMLTVCPSAISDNGLAIVVSIFYLFTAFPFAILVAILPRRAFFLVKLVKSRIRDIMTGPKRCSALQAAF